jgi:transposase
VSHDDVLFGFRLRLFSLAGEIGVRPACRAMGVHHSTYYRWKRRVDRWGLEALRVRERRRPRMPNELGPHLEQRILAFSLAHPGFGPRRISAELAREKWGGLRISANGVWRCLRRHGLSTRARRLSLVAGYAARYERRPAEPEPERHVDASRPGELVGLDCFYIGRLSGTKGALWQYTAIDVASGYAWAERCVQGEAEVSERRYISGSGQPRWCPRAPRQVSAIVAHAAVGCAPTRLLESAHDRAHRARRLCSTRSAPAAWPGCGAETATLYIGSGAHLDALKLTEDDAGRVFVADREDASPLLELPGFVTSVQRIPGGLAATVYAFSNESQLYLIDVDER